MSRKKQRYEFDPQDLDEIMDRIAERRGQVMGQGRSLGTGKEWLQVRDEDGTIRQVPLN
ncbi:MAG: hypothetical protein ACK4P4_02825 [Allorhizobium sp.]